MSKDPEDDALSWGDESDPTHIDSAVPAAAPAPTRDRRANRSKRHDRADATTDSDPVLAESVVVDADLAPDPVDTEAAHTDDDLPPVTSSAVLLSVGILAGIYLLYTVGWFITFQRDSFATLPSEFDTFMARARNVFAILAPALWFASTLVYTRGRRPISRLLWLLVGVVILAPLPFILGN